MRTEHEVNSFQRRTRAEVVSKCRCSSVCDCKEKGEFLVKLYESCIPHDFWSLTSKEVKFNVESYNNVVKKYIKNLETALQNGYGVFFSGDNGVGKTTFISLILKAAINKSRTAYYTTLPDLLYDINKGFRDREVAHRIEYLLSSDFVAIDEIGKDKNKNKFFAAEFHFERILKNRFDAALPTLLASNMGPKEIKVAYGKSVYSMLIGKYQTIAMKEGDFRGELRKRMTKAMEYDEV